MTQADLGERLGVTATAVSHWERGRSQPQAVEVPSLAKALSVSICGLYGVEEGHEATVPVTVTLADLVGRLLGLDAERVEVNVYVSGEAGGSTAVSVQPADADVFQPRRADWDTKRVLELWPDMTAEEQEGWLAFGRALAAKTRDAEPQ